jgi:hypothetical protein
MTPKTLEALQESIAHWRYNEQITDINKARLGPAECALCANFKDHWDKPMCTGCPVFLKTKTRGCRFTPYDDAVFAAENYDLAAFLSAAKDEREFLESLLPKSVPRA